MNTETKQQSEAPQPPPLTQGRMYVEVSQFADAVQKEISIQNEKFKGDPLFNDNDALVMGYVFLAIERLKENCKPLPHTPAPAVSDEEKTVLVKFLNWYNGYSENLDVTEKSVEHYLKVKNSFGYCQSEIEDRFRCPVQCEHCAAYYAPLEADFKQRGSQTDHQQTCDIHGAFTEVKGDKIYCCSCKQEIPAATPAPIAIDGEAEQAAIIHDMRENMVLGWTNEELTKLYLITKK